MQLEPQVTAGSQPPLHAAAQLFAPQFRSASRQAMFALPQVRLQTPVAEQLMVALRQPLVPVQAMSQA